MSQTSSTSPIHVIKIGGNQLDQHTFLQGLVDTVCQVREQGVQPVIVHGGGREIARLHDELGVPFEFHQGLRVTSDLSIRLVKMALGGIANPRIVRWLVNGGIDAIGLSGIDMGLIRVEKYRLGDVDLGRVGRVAEVQAQKLQPLLAANLVPVISPVSLGFDGLSYNVNADHVAAAMAVALGATSLVFITDVAGILIAGRPMRALSDGEIEALIADEHISGGMIPKARAAAAAVQAGVINAIITDLAHYACSEGTFILPGD